MLMLALYDHLTLIVGRSSRGMVVRVRSTSAMIMSGRGETNMLGSKYCVLFLCFILNKIVFILMECSKLY